jgi:predicted MFS family arabinose efflux permease
VLRVRHREPAPERGDARLWRDMGEGVRFVAEHPVLRAIVLSGSLSNLGIVLVLTMLPVVVVDELRYSAAVLGLLLACGGVGMLCGSLVARRLATRFGAGRVLLVGTLVVAPCGFGMPFVGELPMWVATAGWLVLTAQVGVNNVINVSFRQAVTPDRLLGRVNATFRFLLTGALAIGAALAGTLGQTVAPRAALLAGAVLIALVWVPTFFSALRGMRELPA